MEWFRARQDTRQWKEEVEILEAELERTRRFFSWMSSIWTQLTAGPSKPGYAEYAHEKADMHATRAKECKGPHGCCQWQETVGALLYGFPRCVLNHMF